MKILVLAILVVSSNGEITRLDNHQQELFFYREQIKVIHQLLNAECPQLVKVKQQTYGDLELFYQVEAAKKAYQILIQDLVKCRKTKSRNSTVAISTKSSATTMPTVPSKTQVYLPECLSAKNLTGSWRLDHNGSHIRPGGDHSYDGHTCDLHRDLEWFRFTGKAGNI